MFLLLLTRLLNKKWQIYFFTGQVWNILPGAVGIFEIVSITIFCLFNYGIYDYYVNDKKLVYWSNCNKVFNDKIIDTLLLMVNMAKFRLLREASVFPALTQNPGKVL